MKLYCIYCKDKEINHSSLPFGRFLECSTCKSIFYFDVNWKLDMTRFQGVYNERTYIGFFDLNTNIFTLRDYNYYVICQLPDTDNITPFNFSQKLPMLLVFS